MKKFFFVLVLILIIVFATFISDIYKVDSGYLKAGNEIIHKIEKFQQNEGRLPYSLSEIGIQEKLDGGPIYYSLEDDNKYSLSFEVYPGDSALYSSETQKWEYLGEVIDVYPPAKMTKK